MDVIRRMPWLKVLMPFLVDINTIISNRKLHDRLTEAKVQKRIDDREADREADFFTNLLKNRNTELSKSFFISNSSTLIVAGSETTASLLTGLSFYLLKNSRVFERLSEEVRNAFANSEDVTADSTQKLPYLFAVIEEALRIFPPAAAGLQRESPGAEIDGFYVPPGTSVSVSI